MRRMRRLVSGLLVLVLVLTTLGSAAVAATGGAPSTPFVDVFATEYADSVGPLYALGIVGGMSDHIFGVSQPVTRAQMAAFLVRATKLDKDAAPSDSSFSDVSARYWAAADIAKAAAAGYISGYHGAFRPDDQVTEAEAVTMMLRAVGYGSPDLDYPVGYILKAKKVGLLSDDIDFSLSATATRGWVAKVLARMVFQVPIAATNATLSQTRFRVAASLTLGGGDYLLPGSNKLSALGVDWYGQTFPVPATLTVDAGPATVTSDGSLNVTGTDPVQVTATAGSASAQKTFDVLQKLQANPSAVAVSVGTSAMLTVEGVTAGGKHYSVKPPLQVVSGPFTVTADGLVTATAAGNGVVRATLGTLQTDVTVVTGKGLSITPASAVLAPGQTQQFQAFLAGSTVPLDGSTVTWSLQGAGSLSPTGMYTAAGSAPSTITVQVGSLTATTSVSVISSLGVTPSTVRLVSGQTQSFQVVGVSPDGKSMPLTGATCVVNGNVGVMGQGCQMGATGLGQGSVTITYGSLSTTVPVSVSGSAVRIGVVPSAASTPANGRTSVPITIELMDAQGNVVPQGNNVVNVSVSPTTYGVLDSAQVTLVNGMATVNFVPTTVTGNLTILATDPTGSLGSGSTVIGTYQPIPDHIQLTVSPATAQAAIGSITTVTATLVDSNNLPINNNGSSSLTVNLSLSGTVIGSLDTSLLQIPVGQSSGSLVLRGNGATGTASISGTSVYVVQGAQLTAAVAGPAAKLHIRPGYAKGIADGVSTVAVPVELQDVNGVVRTSDYGTILGTLACGSTSQTYSASLVGGVATFQLPSRVAGTCNFTALPNGQALTSDQAQVTFTPGQATQLVLSVAPTNVVPADTVSQVNLTATVEDAQGNVVTTGGYQVAFSRVTNNNATIPPTSMTVGTVNGVATLPVKGNIYTNDDVYTASAPGLNTVGSSGTTVTVRSRVVWYAHHLAVQSVSASSANVGDTVTVVVAVQDSNNFTRIQDSSTQVSLTANSSSAVITPAVQTVTQGVATFTVRDTQAETLILTANSGSLVTATQAVTFNAGNLSRLQLTADATQVAADGHSQATIHAQGYDQFGNPVASNSVVNLSMSGAPGTLSTTTLWANSTATFTAGTTAGTVTITPTIGSMTGTPLVLTLGTAGVPSRVVVDAPATLQASDTPTPIRVRVFDDHGNQVTNGYSGVDLTSVGLRIDGTGGTTTTISGTDLGWLSQYGFGIDGRLRGAASLINGVATMYVTDTKAETITFTPVAYYKGTALQAQPATVTVTPGPAYNMTVSPAPAVYAGANATVVNIAVSITDRWSNPVNASTADQFTVNLGANNQLTDPLSTTYNVNNGALNLTFHTIAGVYGKVTATITSKNTGRTATVDIVGDRAPDAPIAIATSTDGFSTVVHSSDLAARVMISTSVRYESQTVLCTVNGQLVTLYSDAAGTQILSSLPAGTTTLIGYIRRIDLGGLGSKNVQVTLQSALGTGPASQPYTLQLVQ